MNAIVLIVLKRPYTFVVLAILIAIFGGLAARRTPTDIFPNIRIPVVAVVWTYTGLTPEDMSGRVIYYYERGSGFGTTATGTNPVHFNWTSSDGVSGFMYATLADGSVYAGSYFQITSNTTVDTLGPLWDGRGPGWGFGGWADWDTGPEFVTHYSGRVVANLADPEGKHVRCKFQLAHPSDGMAGGGEGDCQLPDGKTIVASFPKAS